MQTTFFDDPFDMPLADLFDLADEAPATAAAPDGADDPLFTENGPNVDGPIFFGEIPADSPIFFDEVPAVDPAPTTDTDNAGSTVPTGPDPAATGAFGTTTVPNDTVATDAATNAPTADIDDAGAATTDAPSPEALAVLEKVFGHTAFRPGQWPLVQALLAGRDVLGVMPTGAGKSVCYQVPACLLPGLTLVISPLISLMQDQVAALGQAGVPAAYLNSTLSPAQQREVLRRARLGSYRILYVAPERLDSEALAGLLAEMPPALVAVDEAHCVSQWGQDFRPGYLQIAAFLARLPRRPAVGAFTATATARVKADIVRLLELRDPLQVTTGFDRPNLWFDVVTPRNKAQWLANWVAARPGQCGIVYCATRKTVEQVCADLCAQGVAAARYHAGLPEAERRSAQQDLLYDRVSVMVATNAFGMGIDKSNISYVIHYNMPKDMESYYQEAGRAGRDGQAAQCVLLYARQDVAVARFLIDRPQEDDPLPEDERQAVLQKELARLQSMVNYCEGDGCLRNALLGYFGEKTGADCGRCGRCARRADGVAQDVTVPAQKMLSGVARACALRGWGVGETMLLAMLRGSTDARLRKLGLDKLSTYGILKGEDPARLRKLLALLQSRGYLQRTEGKYPVLRLTEAARPVLQGQQQVTMYLSREEAAVGRAADRTVKLPRPTVTDEGQRSPLYRRLRDLRTQLAQQQNLPPYIIFSNATLAAMAAAAPSTMAQFRQVPGVGEVKADRYGEAFLREIARWRADGAE